MINKLKNLFSKRIKILNVVDYPDCEQQLDQKLYSKENVYCLAIIDAIIDGDRFSIPVTFIEFDPGFGEYEENEYIDFYSLFLNKEGKYTILEKHNLSISEDYQEYHQEFLDKFSKSKSEINPSKYLWFRNTPSYIQDEIVPLNSKGNEYVFICQINMDYLGSDDCWFYVFFDPETKSVKNLYQRT